MAIKKSVRLIDETIRTCNVISSQFGAETNWSGSLNSISEQFNIMIEEATPELTENEWNAFYCSFNGYLASRSAKEEANLLAWHISESYQYDEQVRGLIGSESDAIALIERVKAMTISERLAIIYKARAYWVK